MHKKMEQERQQSIRNSKRKYYIANRIKILCHKKERYRQKRQCDIREKKCVYCGAVFIPKKSSGQRYCGLLCKNKAAWDRLKSSNRRFKKYKEQHRAAGRRYARRIRKEVYLNNIEVEI